MRRPNSTSSFRDESVSAKWNDLKERLQINCSFATEIFLISYARSRNLVIIPGTRKQSSPAIFHPELHVTSLFQMFIGPSKGIYRPLSSLVSARQPHF